MTRVLESPDVMLQKYQRQPYQLFRRLRQYSRFSICLSLCGSKRCSGLRLLIKRRIFGEIRRKSLREILIYPLTLIADH